MIRLLQRLIVGAQDTGFYSHRTGTYFVFWLATESTNARQGKTVVCYAGTKGLHTRDAFEFFGPDDERPERDRFERVGLVTGAVDMARQAWREARG